ncbi:uncharacterized protein M6B38_111210 [Iris pallida]|uniref:Major facilitator superfamily (MFS) profile domain-containing protein n=1 Tax=Iris pallida TaxID=29817 RepID=A0AAX6DNF8_IRIPA|nr:uncharacterized protein M6B38_111210 [Iris pallida]
MESDPLLRRPDHLASGTVVDYRGCPIGRQSTTSSSTGKWNSALFIIGVEMAERSAYFGISTNLIMFLTDHLGQPMASAAAAVNTWYGVAMMTPLLGAYVADSHLGRYRTIVAASLLYLLVGWLGLGMLTMSVVLPNLSPRAQAALFYFSLYLVAFAQGGHKPCVQAFGADQFDEDDPQEGVARSSFFNWWNFGMGASTLGSLLALTYVQDNLGWGLGFGIPCVLMAVAVVVFLMGTRTYRFYELERESPFARIGRAFAELAKKNRGADQSLASSSSEEESGFPLGGGAARKAQCSSK